MGFQQCKGEFTLAVSINSDNASDTGLIKNNEVSSKMDFNPYLEQLHCFQSGQDC